VFRRLQGFYEPYFYENYLHRFENKLQLSLNHDVISNKTKYSATNKITVLENNVSEK